ncbi:hypothetical protein J7T55_003299 [Diaporthe amygdali]|uniref:uncharacterized protein n=1 Tax=Phomopsis amygdali TaxID=1214568 RepID=UPI0022FF3FC7|nr:uncharacterized protein J7T55_003299 [Diaporthe amygdali]KAJ0122783.1 hypothetical protein J7T55_003299 [Diaporthe amygdali]
MLIQVAFKVFARGKPTTVYDSQFVTGALSFELQLSGCHLIVTLLGGPSSRLRLGNMGADKNENRMIANPPEYMLGSNVCHALHSTFVSIPTVTVRVRETRFIPPGLDIKQEGVPIDQSGVVSHMPRRAWRHGSVSKRKQVFPFPCGTTCTYSADYLTARISRQPSLLGGLRRQRRRRVTFPLLMAAQPASQPRAHMFEGHAVAMAIPFSSRLISYPPIPGLSWHDIIDGYLGVRGPDCVRAVCSPSRISPGRPRTLSYPVVETFAYMGRVEGAETRVNHAALR